MYFPLLVGVLCLSLFCTILLFVLSSFAIILSCYCICSVALPHGAVGWSVVCVFVVFPDHTQLFFGHTHKHARTHARTHTHPHTHGTTLWGFLFMRTVFAI